MRSASLVSVLVSLSLAASTASAANPRVQEGVGRYDEGEFAASEKLLRQALLDRALSDEDRAASRTYLAAAVFERHGEAGARPELRLLFEESVDARIDPRVFPSEFIALAEAVRREVQAERIPTPPAVASAPPEVVAEPPAAPLAAPGGSVKRLAWIPAAAGGVALGASAFFFVRARSEYARIDPDDPANAFRSPAEAFEVARRGAEAQTSAQVLAGVGAAALGAAGAIWLFAGDEPGTLAVLPTHRGLVLSGTLP